MDPRIIFIVPLVVDKIADVVAEYSGEIDGVLPNDATHAATLLNALVGRVTTVTFPLPIDPIDWPLDAVEALSKAMDDGCFAYLVDAWVEPSRGVRVPGRVVYNIGDGERRLDVPWEHGEPALDRPTLLATGLNRADAEALVSRLTVQK